MTALEMYTLSRENVTLAQEIPKDGFDWGDDQGKIRKICINLTTLAQATGQNDLWVAGELQRMSTYYQWKPPRGSEVLFPGLATLAWKYPWML